jgi:ferritin-like metal-binding protein YciE
MSQAERKIVQYLNEAHSAEQGMARVLQTQIAMTPGGRHRDGLEAHLEQTRGHARKLRARLQELEGSSNPLQFGIGLLQSALGQALALSQAPFELVRGSGGEEKVLKNAKDACASEALEIATYTALERLARSVGDTETAALAASIHADEQKMFDRLLAEIPRLTDAVVESEIHGKPSYEVSETGAVDAVRSAGETVQESARRVRGSLRAEEPWPGYDELTVSEIRAALVGANGAEDDLVKRVRAYERSHKDRIGVLSATERDAISRV